MSVMPGIAPTALHLIAMQDIDLERYLHKEPPSQEASDGNA